MSPSTRARAALGAGERSAPAWLRLLTRQLRPAAPRRPGPQRAWAALCRAAHLATSLGERLATPLGRLRLRISLSWGRTLALALAQASLAGQAGAAQAGVLDFSAAERAQIQQHGPWPPPPSPDPGNALAGQPAAIALGQRLFFDPRLSPDGRMACASCHVPGLAFTDGLVRGQGRSPLARNTPSLWNADQARWLGWDGAFDSLWSQALHPLRHPQEMASTAQHLRGLLRRDQGLACAWRTTIGPLPPATDSGSGSGIGIGTGTGTGTGTTKIGASKGSATRNGRPTSSALGEGEGGGDGGNSDTHARTSPLTDHDAALLVPLAKALGAFVGSLRSGRTPFDDFRDALARGDLGAAARYPMAAQRGLRLFIGSGRCQLCHSGPLFSNREFGDIGLPFFVRPGLVDPGRHGGITALQASPFNLLGPFADTPAAAHAAPSASAAAAPQPGPTANDPTRNTRHLLAQERNFGEFKVPSLRNVALTAPYMHDGQLATLADVVQHYDQINLDRLHADGAQLLQPLGLNAAQRADLLAFLSSLSDPQARAWLPGRYSGGPRRQAGSDACGQQASRSNTAVKTR